MQVLYTDHRLGYFHHHFPTTKELPLCQYVKVASKATRKPSPPEEKTEPNKLLNNQRASRLKLKRDVAEDPVVIAALDERYRIQRVNQLAHEEGLPVEKVRGKDMLLKHIALAKKEQSHTSPA